MRRHRRPAAPRCPPTRSWAARQRQTAAGNPLWRRKRRQAGGFLVIVIGRSVQQHPVDRVLGVGGGGTTAREALANRDVAALGRGVSEHVDPPDPHPLHADGTSEILLGPELAGHVVPLVGGPDTMCLKPEPVPPEHLALDAPVRLGRSGVAEPPCLASAAHPSRMAHPCLATIGTVGGPSHATKLLNCGPCSAAGRR